LRVPMVYAEMYTIRNGAYEQPKTSMVVSTMVKPEWIVRTQIFG
jgi:hypothetical protein